MSWVCVGSGTHNAPPPWVNLDTHRGGDTQPDIVVTADDPIPDTLWPCERVLLSHVLEHIKLDDLPAFFAHLRAALTPDSEVLILGPDVYRTLERWRQGLEPWNLVQSVLEHAEYPGTTDWPEACHHWNSHGQRLLEMLKLEGFQAEPLDWAPDDWPSWHYAGWQTAILARLET